MLHKPFKRRLASCLCAVLAATCVLSSLPVGAASGSYGGYEASALVEETVNWALGKSYTLDIPSEDYHGERLDDGLKLTDGTATADYDATLVGWKNTVDATFEVDLEKAREVSQIVVAGYDNNDWGIRNPTKIKVEYYDEATGEWTAAGEDTFERTYDGLDAGPYELPVNVAFNAQKVRVIISRDTENTFAMIGEVRVLGTASEDVAGLPVITTNLPADKSVRVGDAVELLVEAEGNGELSYQWYQDGEVIEGANENTYNIESAIVADSGAYTVVVTNTVGGVSESVTSKACQLTVKDTQAVNILQGIPATTSMHYGDPNAGNETDFPEFGGSEGNYVNNGKEGEFDALSIITDGVRAEGAMNNEAARYNKNYNDLMYADLTFDLGEVKEFAQLNISTLVNLANGIARPSRLQILTSNDEGATKEWEIIYDAPMDSQGGDKEFIYATANDKTYSARFVKLNIFFGGATWIAIDEIELYNETTGDIPDGTIGTVDSEEPEDEGNNLAAKKSYTVNVPIQNDDDLTRLTDGVAGYVNIDGYDGNWAKIPGTNPYQDGEIIIDLEEPASFQQIEMNFLHFADHGVVYPEWVKVEYSADKTDWTLFAEEDIPAISAAFSTYNYQASGAATNARYVKVTPVSYTHLKNVSILQVMLI